MYSPRSKLPAPHQPAYQRSYYPTGSVYADAALALIDRLTRGRADWFQRAFSYLIFGGFSALMNLAVFSLVYYRVSWPAEQQWHYVFAEEVVDVLRGEEFICDDQVPLVPQFLKKSMNENLVCFG